MVEVNDINDLFKVLDEWNAKQYEKHVSELVICRYDDDDKTNAARDGRPICDISVEIYDDYRE